MTSSWQWHQNIFYWIIYIYFILFYCKKYSFRSTSTHFEIITFFCFHCYLCKVFWLYLNSKFLNTYKWLFLHKKKQIKSNDKTKWIPWKPVSFPKLTTSSLSYSNTWPEWVLGEVRWGRDADGGGVCKYVGGCVNKVWMVVTECGCVGVGRVGVGGC